MTRLAGDFPDLSPFIISIETVVSAVVSALSESSESGSRML